MKKIYYTVHLFGWLQISYHNHASHDEILALSALMLSFLPAIMMFIAKDIE